MHKPRSAWQSRCHIAPPGGQFWRGCTWGSCTPFRSWCSLCGWSRGRRGQLETARARILKWWSDVIVLVYWGIATSSFNAQKILWQFNYQLFVLVWMSLKSDLYPARKFYQGFSLRVYSYNGPGLKAGWILALLNKRLISMEFKPAWKVEGRIAFRFFGHTNMNLRCPCTFCVVSICEKFSSFSRLIIFWNW